MTDDVIDGGEIGSGEPEVIAGKYELGGLIGAGGFSRVYKARHVEMRRTVALKLLDLAGAVASTGNTTASDLEKRFSREARVVSTLTHPNTITVYDFGFDGPSERWYIAMEFIDGSDLHNALRKQGAFAPERAARIAADVLRALAEAHHHGILHRDLKPANVMLAKDFAGSETAKVLDFGVATITGVGREGDDDLRAMTATRTGGFVGTPQYAAPEQFAGDRLTPATDIYAVGLLLWEMLLGKAAIGEAAFGKCLQRHLSKAPWQFPAGTDVPDGLARIVYAALEKDPAERYGSATAMADDLEKWLDGDRESFDPAPSTVVAWEPAIDYGGEEPVVTDPNLGFDDVPELLRPPLPAAEKPVAVQSRKPVARREEPLELDYSRAGARIEGSDRVVRPSDARPPRRRKRGSFVSPRLVAGVVAAVAVAAIGYSLFPSQTQDRIDLEELLATEPMHIDLRTNGALPREAPNNRFTASGIIRALEIDGWSVRRMAQSTELSLANVHEQGYRLSRRGTELQIELVTTKSNAIAGQMASDTRAPILPVIFDNKMVRVFPPTRGPQGASADVVSLLSRYRDLVLDGAGEP